MDGNRHRGSKTYFGYIIGGELKGAETFVNGRRTRGNLFALFSSRLKFDEEAVVFIAGMDNEGGTLFCRYGKTLDFTGEGVVKSGLQTAFELDMEEGSPGYVGVGCRVCMGNKEPAACSAGRRLFFPKLLKEVLHFGA